MKKIFIILALFSMLLFGGQASWSVDGYDADFNKIVHRAVSVDYTGQAILFSTIKSVTANQNQLDLTYTSVDTCMGCDSLGQGGITYYGIEPKGTFDNQVVWVKFEPFVIVRY